MFTELIRNSDLYGFLAAVLTTLAFLPQVIRTFKTKSAADVSFVMLIMFLTGVLFWILYGFQTHSVPVIIANAFTFILNLSILILKLTYRNNQSEINTQS